MSPYRGDVPRVSGQPAERPIVEGGVVILTGEWLSTARKAVLIADGARRRNGLASLTAYTALAEALTSAMSANGHSDVRKTVDVQDYSRDPRTVTVAEAAKQLGLSRRHIRRIASRLGGERRGKVWLFDQDAIDEHKKGQKWTETA